MKIQNNSNLKFGQLKKIECISPFSCSRKGQDAAVAALLNSDAYKQFGETYDYIAKFYWKYPRYWRGESFSKPNEYTLELELPNDMNPGQPILINAAGYRDADLRCATKGFIKAIENNTYEQLNGLVKGAKGKLQRSDSDAEIQRQIDETIAKNKHLF